jgi:hypothetical protein
MNIEQSSFLKYVRTKMVFSLRLRSESDEAKPVHIKSTEIEKRFFPYNKRDQLQDLVNQGELSITQKGKANFYEALKPEHLI